MYTILQVHVAKKWSQQLSSHAEAAMHGTHSFKDKEERSKVAKFT